MNSGKQKRNKIQKKRSEKRDMKIPLNKEIYSYHHTPDEWTFFNLRDQYIELARRLKVKNPLEIRLDADNYRYDLLQYFSEGIKKGDAACIEISVQFVSAKVFFFWSGYTRARMAARLKSTDLTSTQKTTLREGIYKILESDKFGQEIKDLIRLLKKIGFGRQEKKFRELPERFYTKLLFETKNKG